MSRRSLFVLALVAALPCLALPAFAQNSSSVHEGSWPIEHGIKHQPTRGEGGEFSRSQQEETDRLYNELMSNSFGATHHTGTARMR
jgi:hypothetical protein